MTRNYETRCWLCNSTDLQPDTRGMICRSCGATYNLIPKPTGDCLTENRDYGLGAIRKDAISSRSPSLSATRRAKKAHGDS